MKAVLVFALLAVAVCALDLSAPAINPEMIAMINRDNSVTWTAGINSRFINATLRDAAALCGTWLEGGPQLEMLPPVNDSFAPPAEFDARVQWGTQCPSTKEIRDQANCGSCWAFGAVEAMTDRICITSKGASQVHISAADMNSCCGSCGMGCNGGYPSAAWQYWVSTGVVSGGNYKGEGCFPYQLPNCDHHTTGKYGPCPAVVPTPACTKKCTDSKSWLSDKHHGANSYHVPSRVADIQNELMTHGPIEVAFSVYEDFLSYKSGVYHHTSGQMLGGHAVKMIGWGTSAGTPYWTIVNSWNEDWGNQGVFLIRRGNNECGIESQAVAGLPKL